MIEEAWDEYRGWAKRARTLQISSHRWSRVAFLCAGLAAILGAAASQVPDGSISGRTLAFLAAVVAAVTPILGREILSVDSEARWIRARDGGGDKIRMFSLRRWVGGLRRLFG